MKKKVFFGWYVVGFALVALLLGYGIRFGYGVFLPAMMKELHWSKTMLSGVQSASLVVTALMAPLSGYLFDKYGPKWLIGGGAVLIGLSMVTIGKFVSTPIQMYLIYGIVLAIGVNGMGQIVNTAMIANWFIKKRAMAVAIIGSGLGLGVFVITPIANKLITAYGWRNSFVILGIALMVIVIPGTILFAKKRPEDMGLEPDGGEVAEGEIKKARIERPDVSITVKEGMRSRVFYLLIFAQMCFSIGWYMLSTHQVSYAIGLGMSAATAAGAFSLVGGMSIVGRLLFGTIADRLQERKYVMIMGVAVYTIGLVVLLQTKGVYSLYLYAALCGLGYGGFNLIGAVAGDQFGRKAFGSLYGYLGTGGALGGSLGPVLGGYIFDNYQSYALAWETAIALCLVSFVLLLLVPKPPYMRNA